MDAAEVGLEILKVFPYVAAAGFAGAAVVAAFHRGAGLQAEGSRGAGVAGEGSPSRLAPALQTSAAWGRRQLRRLSSRWHFSAVQAGVGCALAAALIAVPAVLQRQAAEPSAQGLAGSAFVALRPLEGADGALKFGAIAATALPDPAEPHEASALAWFFGALVSGGRSAEAYALLTPEAQRATPADEFAALLGGAYLLRGSDDTPWRIPGSDVFLFSVSERDSAAVLKGELRLGLERVDGQWRVASFKLWERKLEAGAGARGVR